MAGITTDAIASALGTKRVVRTMPNLALAKGQGLTAWFNHDSDVKPMQYKAFSMLGYIGLEPSSVVA